MRCFALARDATASGPPAAARVAATAPAPRARRCSRSPASRRAYRSGRGGPPGGRTTSRSRSSPGECVALVGESGSGKTTIAPLHRRPARAQRRAGSCSTAQRSPAPPARARSSSGARIQIVFQNPFESLNPRQRVAPSIARPLRVLRRLSRAEAEREVGELLERVRLPARLADRFPGELSGGERQRVAIARALAARPDLLVCDEVTSALDVSVQAAVLELLAELRRELELSMLFITHNLGVVACVADAVLVLDQGRAVRDRPGRRGVLLEPERRLHPAAARAPLR